MVHNNDLETLRDGSEDQSPPVSAVSDELEGRILFSPEGELAVGVAQQISAFVSQEISKVISLMLNPSPTTRKQLPVVLLCLPRELGHFRVVAGVQSAIARAFRERRISFYTPIRLARDLNDTVSLPRLLKHARQLPIFWDNSVKTPLLIDVGPEAMDKLAFEASVLGKVPIATAADSEYARSILRVYAPFEVNQITKALDIPLGDQMLMIFDLRCHFKQVEEADSQYDPVAVPLEGVSVRTPSELGDLAIIDPPLHDRKTRTKKRES